MRINIAHVVSKVMNRQSITKDEHRALIKTVKNLGTLAEEAMVR